MNHFQSSKIYKLPHRKRRSFTLQWQRAVRLVYGSPARSAASRIEVRRRIRRLHKSITVFAIGPGWMTTLQPCEVLRGPARVSTTPARWALQAIGPTERGYAAALCASGPDPRANAFQVLQHAACAALYQQAAC